MNLELSDYFMTLIVYCLLFLEFYTFVSTVDALLDLFAHNPATFIYRASNDSD
jgi:hypothetical protein